MRKSIFLIACMLYTMSVLAQFVNRKYQPIEPANIVVTYQLMYQQDSTNSSAIRNTKLLLFIGNKTSKFVSHASFMSDTATRRFTSKEQVIEYLTDPKRPYSGIQYEIYKNYPQGKLTVVEYIPSDSFLYEEDLNAFTWILTTDTTTLNGYKTQKATCDYGSRSWTAWFCPDLPYSDGPYKFNGLPGLILKVYDSRNHYVFEMLTVNTLDPPLMIDIHDKEYVKTTKQGFFRAQDSFREDIINRAKEAGMDNVSQQTAARNMAIRNNPIELKRKQIE